MPYEISVAISNKYLWTLQNSMTSLPEILLIIVFILPAYFANSAPVFFRTGASRIPIDLKIRFFDRRRLLGKGKTWPGFFIGIIVGTFIGILTSYFVDIYPTKSMHVMVAFLMSVGTMVGDSLGSFIKRRLDVRSGRPAYLLDQLPFILVALAVVYPFWPSILNIQIVAGLLILTVVIHQGANWIAYKTGMKKVPW